MTVYDAIVVGLGVMGSAAAYHLSRRGQHVLGLDAFAPGHTNGSSHGESRMTRLAYYEHPSYLPLIRRAYDLWAELQAEARTELLRLTGGVFIGRPTGEMVACSIATARLEGLDHEVLDAAAIRRRYPVFRPDDDEIALFDPRAGILHADRCVAAQRRLATEHGATLRDEAPIRSWAATEDEVEVRTDAGRFEAARLVITAGPWLGTVLMDLALPLKVERIPVFYWEPRDSVDWFALGRLPVYMWDRGGAGIFYGFPQLAQTGVKAGRHHNDDWCDPETVDRVVNHRDERMVRDFLARHIPALDGPLHDRFVCLYTVTPDQHFVIDRHPRFPQVVYAGGFSGHGFKFGPVVGELLVDLALTERTDPAASFLRADRFGVATAVGEATTPESEIPVACSP